MKNFLVALFFTLPIIALGQPDTTNTPAPAQDSIQFIEVIMDCAHGHICCQVGCACCPEGSGILNHLNLPPMTPRQMRKYMRRQRRASKS